MRVTKRAARAAGASLALPPPAAMAHALTAPAAIYAPWDGAEGVVLLLVLAAAAAYALGERRLRTGTSAPRHARAARLREPACFFAGLAVLAITLPGPVAALASRSFAAHMLEHEIVMLLAAPLLVLGRPLARFAWAWPAASRRRLRRLARVRPLVGWSVLTSVAGACAVQSLALFAWHVPAWFRAASSDTPLHVLQHATFLATALCFWWTVLRPGPPRRVAASAIASLFITTLTTGALGALLTFGTRVWYAVPGFDPPLGMTLLEDQQLGGLLMWVPGGAVYLVAALVIGARALAAADAHAARARMTRGDAWGAR
jgi:putative membrane protein